MNSPAATSTLTNLTIKMSSKKYDEAGSFHSQKEYQPHRIKKGIRIVLNKDSKVIKVIKALFFEGRMFLVLGTGQIRDIETWPLDVDRGIVPGDAAFA